MLTKGRWKCDFTNSQFQHFKKLLASTTNFLISSSKQFKNNKCVMMKIIIAAHMSFTPQTLFRA